MAGLLLRGYKFGSRTVTSLPQSRSKPAIAVSMETDDEGMKVKAVGLVEAAGRKRTRRGIEIGLALGA